MRSLIHTGQPVAWCIADREDTLTMSLFLGKLHERSLTTEVKTVMTDDGKYLGLISMVHIIEYTDNAGWTAAQNVLILNTFCVAGTLTSMYMHEYMCV